MDLPLELNKNRQVAKIVIAGENDFGFLSGWREKLGKDQNPFRVDSVAFAQLVIDRFSMHSAIQPYVTSTEDIGDHIKSNPHSEVAGVALLTCDWFHDSPVLGLCHFRRTWCNNIILDYLASHPFIAKRPDGYSHHVKGVGLALLYFLSRLAERYGCEYIWGEATQLSCDYYKKVLSLDSVKDLILIPRDKFVEFAKQLDSVWQGKSRAMTRDNLTVQEVYQLEEEKPPMVGNRSAVFSPPRRLVQHFLDLPKHVQMEIVRALGLLQDEDKGQPDAELFRLFFRRATESGKLSDLWDAVEKNHPDGKPDENPFRERT
jgi:hypothetical protein